MPNPFSTSSPSTASTTSLGRRNLEWIGHRFAPRGRRARRERARRRPHAGPSRRLPLLAKPPCQVATGLEPRVLGKLATRSRAVSALLEREPEAVVRLGQTRIEREGGSLLPHGILGAAGVEIEEAEVALDPRVVGIEGSGRLELCDGLGESAHAVEAESVPR